MVKSFVTSVAVVVAFVGAVSTAACSGKATGTGTGDGGGSTIGGGTGTSGGTVVGSSGTSGTPTGGSTTLPTTCTSTSDDDLCASCLKAACCTETVACAHDADCDAVFRCAKSCGDQTCTDACISDHPGGRLRLNAFVACEQQNCSSYCTSTTTTP